MKTFFLVLWRIIRWIIYLALILVLPFVGAYGATWALNHDANIVTTYKVEAFELVDLKYQLAFVKTSETELSNSEVLINDELPIFSVSFWKVSINYLETGDKITKFEAVKDDVVIVEPGDINEVIHFDATYFILGSIAFYIIVCIIAGTRRHKKKMKKKLAEAREGVTSPDDLLVEEQVEEEVIISDSAAEENITDDIIAPIQDPIVEEIEPVPAEDYIEDDFLISDAAIEEEDFEDEIEEKVDEVTETTEAVEVPKSEFATKWVKKLAENGDKEAQYTLAVYYANGYKDIEQNEILAKYWLEKSASQGFEKAIKAKIENE